MLAEPKYEAYWNQFYHDCVANYIKTEHRRTRKSLLQNVLAFSGNFLEISKAEVTGRSDHLCIWELMLVID
jgi:hypothetical protein